MNKEIKLTTIGYIALVSNKFGAICKDSKVRIFDSAKAAKKALISRLNKIAKAKALKAQKVAEIRQKLTFATKQVAKWLKGQPNYYFRLFCAKIGAKVIKTKKALYSFLSFL